MKNNKILKDVTERAVQVWRGLKMHPVELLVLLYTAVALIFNWDGKIRQMPVYYSTFAVTAALCLSFYRDRRWAAVAYWAVLPFFALCALLPERWPKMTEFWILTALLPAVYLLSRRCRDNKGFSQRIFSLVRSLVVAAGIGSLSFMLLELVYRSIDLLFLPKLDDISDLYTIHKVIMAFSYIVLAPMVFIGMESDTKFKASRLEEILVNWVFTPVLLIYNVMLYVYVAVILVNWDLPEGSVATMVSLFMFAAVAIRWLRPTLSKRTFGWYFRWFGVIAIPLVTLFWVACIYRINQYGLTIDRCLLLAAGTMMTIFVIVSLIKQAHSGYWFLVMFTVVGLVLAVGGPLSARQMSLRSQTAVVRKEAAKIGILSEEGTIQFQDSSFGLQDSSFGRDDADSIYRREHRVVYQTLRYIENELADTAATRERLGITSSRYLDHLSKNTAYYAKNTWVDSDYDTIEAPLEGYCWIAANESVEIADVGKYSRLYSNIEFKNGKIRLGGTTIDADTVLATQLALIGYTLESNLDCSKLRENRDLLCTYRSPDGNMVIVFENMNIEMSKRNHLENGEISVAVVK